MLRLWRIGVPSSAGEDSHFHFKSTFLSESLDQGPEPMHSCRFGTETLELCCSNISGKRRRGAAEVGAPDKPNKACGGA